MSKEFIVKDISKGGSRTSGDKNRTVTSQDGLLFWDDESKQWMDNDGNVGYYHKRVCSKCNKPRLDLNGVADCDFCLQGLSSCSFISGACCGHSDPSQAYISLKDGRRFVLDVDWSPK